MDGAAAGYQYPTIAANIQRQWVGGREGCDAVMNVNSYETAFSEDLGGSSKYSNENFEDWSGEGFHVNSNWTWVSRS